MEWLRLALVCAFVFSLGFHEGNSAALRWPDDTGIIETTTEQDLVKKEKIRFDGLMGNRFWPWLSRTRRQAQPDADPGEPDASRNENGNGEESEHSQMPNPNTRTPSETLEKVKKYVQRIVQELSRFNQKFTLRLIRMTSREDLAQMPELMKDFEISETRPIFFIAGGLKYKPVEETTLSPITSSTTLSPTTITTPTTTTTPITSTTSSTTSIPISTTTTTTLPSTTVMTTTVSTITSSSTSTTTTILPTEMSTSAVPISDTPSTTSVAPVTEGSTQLPDVKPDTTVGMGEQINGTSASALTAPEKFETDDASLNDSSTEAEDSTTFAPTSLPNSEGSDKEVEVVMEQPEITGTPVTAASTRKRRFVPQINDKTGFPVPGRMARTENPFDEEDEFPEHILGIRAIIAGLKHDSYAMNSPFVPEKQRIITGIVEPSDDHENQGQSEIDEIEEQIGAFVDKSVDSIHQESSFSEHNEQAAVLTAAIESNKKIPEMGPAGNKEGSGSDLTKINESLNSETLMELPEISAPETGEAVLAGSIVSSDASLNEVNSENSASVVNETGEKAVDQSANEDGNKGENQVSSEDEDDDNESDDDGETENNESEDDDDNESEDEANNVENGSSEFGVNTGNSQTQLNGGREKVTGIQSSLTSEAIFGGSSGMTLDTAPPPQGTVLTSSFSNPGSSELLVENSPEGPLDNLPNPSSIVDTQPVLQSAPSHSLDIGGIVPEPFEVAQPTFISEIPVASSGAVIPEPVPVEILDPIAILNSATQENVVPDPIPVELSQPITIPEIPAPELSVAILNGESSVDIVPEPISVELPQTNPVPNIPIALLDSESPIDIIPAPIAVISTPDLVPEIPVAILNDASAVNVVPEPIAVEVPKTDPVPDIPVAISNSGTLVDIVHEPIPVISQPDPVPETPVPVAILNSETSVNVVPDPIPVEMSQPITIPEMPVSEISVVTLNGQPSVNIAPEPIPVISQIDQVPEMSIVNSESSDSVVPEPIPVEMSQPDIDPEMPGTTLTDASSAEFVPERIPDEISQPYIVPEMPITTLTDAGSVYFVPEPIPVEVSQPDIDSEIPGTTLTEASSVDFVPEPIPVEVSQLDIVPEMPITTLTDTSSVDFVPEPIPDEVSQLNIVPEMPITTLTDTSSVEFVPEPIADEMSQSDRVPLMPVVILNDASSGNVVPEPIPIKMGQPDLVPEIPVAILNDASSDNVVPELIPVMSQPDSIQEMPIAILNDASSGNVVPEPIPVMSQSDSVPEIPAAILNDASSVEFVPEAIKIESSQSNPVPEFDGVIAPELPMTVPEVDPGGASPVVLEQTDPENPSDSIIADLNSGTSLEMSNESQSAGQEISPQLIPVSATPVETPVQSINESPVEEVPDIIPISIEQEAPLISPIISVETIVPEVMPIETVALAQQASIPSTDKNPIEIVPDLNPVESIPVATIPETAVPPDPLPDITVGLVQDVPVDAMVSSSVNNNLGTVPDEIIMDDTSFNQGIPVQTVVSSNNENPILSPEAIPSEIEPVDADVELTPVESKIPGEIKHPPIGITSLDSALISLVHDEVEADLQDPEMDHFSIPETQSAPEPPLPMDGQENQADGNTIPAGISPISVISGDLMPILTSQIQLLPTKPMIQDSSPSEHFATGPETEGETLPHPNVPVSLNVDDVSNGMVIQPVMVLPPNPHRPQLEYEIISYMQQSMLNPIKNDPSIPIVVPSPTPSPPIISLQKKKYLTHLYFANIE